ncbi:hypothetical protein ACWGNN_01090 [Streptomyces sp. NPDC055817]|uniref:hypothetical protein n=1 Tax=Streptomyces sp. NPDC056723 TaxID=3345925 RepID=UPI0036893FC9
MSPKAPASATRTPVSPAEEILEITTVVPADDPEERRTLFTVDGEEFTVPKVIDERIAFLAMNYMRTEGALFGAMYLTQLILGEAQYNQLTRLLAEQRITHATFEKVTDRVNDLFFNRTKEPADGAEPAAGKAGPTPDSQSS